MLRSPSSAWSRPLKRRDWVAARYLPEALAALVLVRLGLTIIGLAGVRSLGLREALPNQIGQFERARLGRAIRLAARAVPFASCLTQAEAGQILLARRGIASTVCLGVRETAIGALAAHAWLISDGRVVIGGGAHGIAGFRPLAELGPIR